MDCEGCEYLALGDADLSNIKIICMELHSWEGLTDELSKVEKQNINYTRHIPRKRWRASNYHFCQKRGIVN